MQFEKDITIPKLCHATVPENGNWICERKPTAAAMKYCQTRIKPQTPIAAG